MTAQFSDLQPKDTQGVLRNAFVTVPLSARATTDIDDGTIFQMTPNNAFRIGQQVIFWIGISNDADPDTGQYIERIRLKPWWARPNMEYRQGGAASGLGAAASYFPIDRQVFDGTVLDNNRYIWMPSPKRLDVTPFATVTPPPVSPARQSDSVFLDDLWTFDLRDPTDPGYTAPLQAGQVVARWDVFMYPAMGYALGFTWDADFADGGEAAIDAQVSLTYAIGTLGGTDFQTSIG